MGCGPSLPTNATRPWTRSRASSGRLRTRCAEVEPWNRDLTRCRPSVDRNPNRAQNSSFDIAHDGCGNLSAERILAQEIFGKGRDLLALEHTVLRHSTMPLLQTYVRRGFTKNRARGNDEDIARQSVPNVHRDHERRSPFPATLAWKDDPVQAAAERSLAQRQVFRI